VILTELTGIKNFSNEQNLIQLFQKYIEETGYDLLGSGQTGVVLKHPEKNEVIKFWYMDEAYEDFIEYASTHNNKHLVKILSKPKKITITTKNKNGVQTKKKINYVRLELLKPYSRSINLFGISFAKFNLLLAFMAGQQHKNTFNYIVSSVIENPETYRILEIDREKIDIEGLRDFIKVYVACMNAMKTDNIWADLHNENIMMRGNIPVIVDPAADEGAIDATDWFLQQNDSENIKSLATKNKFPTLSGL
jgi:hypothetical protein